MRTHVQRRDFFRLAGITVAGAGSLLAAPRAQALPPKPVQDDFGYVQFGVVAELVCEAFYRRAIAEGDWTHGERRRLAIARDGDTRHLRKLNGLLGPVSSGLQAARFLEPAGREVDTYLRLESFVNQGGS